MDNRSYTVQRAEAAERSLLAATHMTDCRLCAWECGVDRTTGPVGACRAGAWPRVFHTGIEWVGENAFAPTLLLNFSGCNMRCSFCLTGGDSQDAAAGKAFDVSEFASAVAAAHGTIKSVTIEGGEPSIYLPAALQALSVIPRDIPAIWKTNGYASEEALALLDGLDITWLIDYKFGNDACAWRLARVPHYLEVVQRNMLAAGERLVVRHLLMPGHIECCFKPAVAWLAEALPGARLTLMNGFVPRWKSARHPELLNGLSAGEMRQARHAADAAGIRLEPWVLRMPPTSHRDSAATDRSRISIDRHGRVLSEFVSADLSRVLGRLSAELGVCTL